MKLSSVNSPLPLVAAGAGLDLDLSDTPSIFSPAASLASCSLSAIAIFAFAAALLLRLAKWGAIKAGLILDLGLGGGIMLTFTSTFHAESAT